MINNQIIKAFDEGITLSDAKQYKEALAKFDLAIESGIYKEVYTERGICLQNLNFHLDAIDDFTKAIELSPTDANNFFLRSMSEKAIGEYDIAILDNKQAIILSKLDSEENKERDQKAKQIGYETATDFYVLRLQLLESQSNFSEFSKRAIIKPKIRRS